MALSSDGDDWVDVGSGSLVAYPRPGRSPEMR
jgi:hypothetical protein